jgi:hypothetical protein
LASFYAKVTGVGLIFIAVFLILPDAQNIVVRATGGSCGAAVVCAKLKNQEMHPLRSEQNMRARITLSVAAIALGAVVISAPAFAQTYSNMQKNGAPISPNGLAAAANSYGGPSGMGGAYLGPGTTATPAAYSNAQQNGAPISPNGLAAAANSYGGPSGMGGAYLGPNTKVTPAPYSNLTKSGHPISPNGLAAAANSMGGPGYQGN